MRLISRLLIAFFLILSIFLKGEHLKKIRVMREVQQKKVAFLSSAYEKRTVRDEVGK